MHTHTLIFMRIDPEQQVALQNMPAHIHTNSPPPPHTHTRTHTFLCASTLSNKLHYETCLHTYTQTPSPTHTHAHTHTNTHTCTHTHTNATHWYRHANTPTNNIGTDRLTHASSLRCAQTGTCARFKHTKSNVCSIFHRHLHSDDV